MKQTKLDRAISLIVSDYKFMVQTLKDIQKGLGRGEDIDVRLCIDFNRDGEPEWIIRHGLSDYDQRHSEACGGSSVCKQTKLKIEPCCDILEDMINQCLDQLRDAGE